MRDEASSYHKEIASIPSEVSSRSVGIGASRATAGL